MASKTTIKDATKENASILMQMVQGGTQDVNNVNNVNNVNSTNNVKGVKRGKRAKYPNEVRISLMIPMYIKEYLQAAAYRESNAKHTVSITEYLCDLVVADMEKHKDD